MPVLSHKELTLRFSHHPPRTEQVMDLHAEVRKRCLDLAEWMNENLPENGLPEAERAIDAVDDACKHANAAIARRISGGRGTGISDGIEAV